jgi:TonB-dependent receptor-like protein
MLRRLLCIVTCVGVAHTSAAQGTSTASPAPAYRNRLAGVYDGATGATIEGASVTDLKSGTLARTTKTGTVSLSFLPDGGSLVEVRKVGYLPVSQFVAITPSDTAPVTFVLSPSVTSLPAVVTRDSATGYMSPRLREFNERQKSGFGHFITESELRKADNRKMKDVLDRLPGVQILCSKSAPFDCHAVSFRALSKYAVSGGGRCTIAIYVDGVLSTESDLNSFNVSDYAGIESYGGGATIPVRYNMTSDNCGALLFWTREK